MKKQQIAIIAKTINFELLDVMTARFKVPFTIITPKPTEMGNRNARVIYDNDLLNRNEFFQKCTHPRPGWLYQQFLKYQAVIESDFENTLIIDGDSLIIDEKFLTTFSLYHTRKTIENFYNNFISRTLGDTFVSSKNYITNQMNFNKEALLSMLNTAFGSHEEYHDFIMNFLQQNPNAEFSEYQTYAAWLTNKRVSRRELIRVFRRHDFIKINPLDSLKKYDLIAFEDGHKTDRLREIRAKLLYLFSMNLG